MIVHAFALCWNDLKMLPFYLQHYSKIVDHFTIFDDGSTDGSIEYLRQFDNVTLERFHNDGDSFVKNAQELNNECWKKSIGKADWVMIGNLDEHFFCRKMKKYLEKCHIEGITVLPSKGYQMTSMHFPKPSKKLSNIVRMGVELPKWDKIAFFNPNEIKEICFSIGRHESSPIGNVIYPEKTEIKLLHYKYLDLDFVYQRHQSLNKRLKSLDIIHRWGYQYSRDEQESKYIHYKIIKDSSLVVKRNLIYDLYAKIQFIPAKIGAKKYLKNSTFQIDSIVD